MTDSLMSGAPASPPSPVIVERLEPCIDGGRYAVKREVGDTLMVSADIFRDGHEKVASAVKYRRWDEETWHEAPMRFVDNDRWEGSVPLDEVTRYVYTVESWPDHYTTWRDEIGKKLAAGLDVSLEIREGTIILDGMVSHASDLDAATIREALRSAEDAPVQTEAVALLTATGVVEAAGRAGSRAGSFEFEPHLTVQVDRRIARFAAWYSMFPRSAGTVPGQSATFLDVIAQLPRLHAMGFDVLYFTPIHPIGTTKRKGKNNTLVAGPDDPGVPYGIGSPDGGHDAIEPGLGTLEDFRELVAAAHEHGMEIALDVALQGSPDHPWVKAHPEWFFNRPDGSIRTAENPPKKYEDIYPLNFENANWQGLWEEIRRVIMHWVDNGVRTFRVDNPHTKPTAFWEWLITEVHRTDPDVIFLSEAFTRPKVMRSLAKAGFAQSYTYFTWRNFKHEIMEYVNELTQSEMKEYYRGNFFTNTHDILPYILQEGGRPAFRFRVVLAATLSSVYGIYSGYELCENTAVPGKEEYLNSEKYEFKVWDWDRPGNISDEIAALNRIRREHPALQEYDNVSFLRANDDNVICYIKALPEANDYVLVAVNLDPFQTHGTGIEIPHHILGTGPDDRILARELLTDEASLWQGHEQWVDLDPQVNPAMLFSLRVWQQKDYEEPCY